MSGIAELMDFRRFNFAPRKKSKSSLVETKSEFVNKQEVLLVMAKLFQTKVFVLEHFTFSEFTSPNPFSKSDVYNKMEVTVTNSQGKKEDHFFFVKKLTGGEENTYEREVKKRGFLREFELYSTTFADFEKSDREGTNRWGPKHYYSKAEKLLILEDFTSKGYYQVGRRECLDKEHILAVIKSLAAFHSATIKLEEKINSKNATSKGTDANAGRPVTVVDIYSNINFDLESAKIKYHYENVFHEAGIKSQQNLVDQLPGYSREEIQEIKNQLPELLRNMPQLGKPSTKYRNVLVHGSLGPNNFFFRRNGSDLEAVLVDFQTVRYAPPSYDLIMLLYLNQRMVFRMKEMQSLIQAYYNMFSDELAKNGICVQAVLPVKDYLESCEECVEWVTLATVMYLQIHLLSDEIIQKYMPDQNSYNKNMFKDRTEMLAESFSKDEIYRTRMTEAMNDLIKKCVKLQ